MATGHDRAESAVTFAGIRTWWLLISAIPVIGGLVLLFFMVQPSKTEAIEYGMPPAR